MHMSRRLASVSATALLLALAPAAHAGCGLGDLDGNGTVDGADLGMLLASWGRGGAGDLDANGTIDGADLGIMLASWGPTTLECGGFPPQWISGAPNCSTEPPIQVHWYNENLAILRQSLCTNFEGPFIMLLFGQDKVLMMDTGAGNISLAPKVQEVVADWLADHEQDSIELVVAHTHGHGDHVAGNAQFVNLPNTVLVGNSQTAVKTFFGITNWPDQIVEYDLGGRIVDIIPIPGHQSAHIAVYDRATGLLLTGDTLYPGRLYISSFAQYMDSIDRLVAFTADKPVCWVLGTHIEMSNTPGDDFPVGSISHPDEHPLQLTKAHLLELQAAIHAMAEAPHYEVHDDFIIFPLGGAAGGARSDAGGAASGGEDDARCCARPQNMFELGRLMAQ
ncbi:MAG: MBL fold metallo-hydrolase [Phycisphaerales bacterium]|nr:MBL fold metallo-hydrolase [Phycisphaerales bacterium]